MIDIFVLRSLRPIFEMSTLNRGHQSSSSLETYLITSYPSIEIEPPFNSTMRNKASINELLPAPVLTTSQTDKIFSNVMHSPPDDANFLPTFDTERDTLQDVRKTGPVAESDILDVDRPFLRPGFVGFLLLDFMRWLLWDHVSSAVLDNWKQARLYDVFKAQKGTNLVRRSSCNSFLKSIKYFKCLWRNSEYLDFSILTCKGSTHLRQLG